MKKLFVFVMLMVSLSVYAEDRVEIIIDDFTGEVAMRSTKFGCMGTQVIT